MICKYDFEEITKYFEGNLSKEKNAEIAAHVDTCKICSTVYRSLNLTKKYVNADVAYKGNVLCLIEESLDKDKYRRGKKWLFFLDKLLFNNKNIIKSSIATAIVLVFIAFTLQNWYINLNDEKLKGEKIANNAEEHNNSPTTSNNSLGNDSTIVSKSVTEEKIFKKLLEEGDTKLKLKEILENIQPIDWKIYEKVSNGKSIDLLNFIYININFVENNDIPFLLRANKNLDGAYSELYSSIIGKLFIRDKFQFVKILSKLSPQEIKAASEFVSYYCSSSSKNVIEEMKELLKSSDIGDDEKNTVKILIGSLDEILTMSPEIPTTYISYNGYKILAYTSTDPLINEKTVKIFQDTSLRFLFALIKEDSQVLQGLCTEELYSEITKTYENKEIQSMYKDLVGAKITGFESITSPIISEDSNNNKKVYVNILFNTSSLSRVVHFSITFSNELETPKIESFGI